jgi:hypothetical protein
MSAASLPLHPEHPVVERARHHHVAQSNLQFVRIEMRMPWTDGRVGIIQHTDEFRCQRLDVADPRRDVGTSHGTGR